MTTLNKSESPKFNAGDMIAGQEEIDGEMRWFTYMVNRVIVHPIYGNMYSLDNGSGHIDARDTCANIDAHYSR